MRTAHGSAVHATDDDKAAADSAKAAEEREAPPIGREHGFKEGAFENDPADAANPNEVIERHRRTLRPTGDKP